MKIKKNRNYWGWLIIFIIFIPWGISALVTGEISSKEGIYPITGVPARILGLVMVLWSLYAIYFFIFKAETKELERKDYKELKNNEQIVNGFKTVTKIENYGVMGKTFIPVFDYIIEIKFHDSLNLGLKIERRDIVEYFFWKIGLSRWRDLLTGNSYFDSRYWVSCQNKDKFNKIFSGSLINELVAFDYNYPPIRKKNGKLRLSDLSICYREGPYKEDERIFDPHRGNIENIINELIKIIEKVNVQVSKSALSC